MLRPAMLPHGLNGVGGAPSTDATSFPANVSGHSTGACHAGAQGSGRLLWAQPPAGVGDTTCYEDQQVTPMQMVLRTVSRPAQTQVPP
jgi:hypothetical protein